ncbi:MAG: tryptophan synthase subunit alpha [Sulfurovum sp.]|nr:tryptophan synthase subunit alpha [Sulfurovum sp.]MCB4749905.1 tryptophan synthase subunit alpha [Sulfurovum sp.]MCB4751323.1 tryptophan synthase subunit alpha [Sulfurovum sp.]MCB4752755.1 tryptophan synthase subunit alpha [Sulfurovum sp.]MCB4760703.1 tryptophan synthase subunit alpha [Sulfurovum sp.]
MKQLVAYITTGFPSINFTIDVALALAEAGVDTLELGIPFSDPVADGPVIEAANLKALQSGFRLQKLFDASLKIAPHIDTLWMGYFNPFYHKGMETFINEANKVGVNGFIIPDLPFEEAQPYKPIIEKAGLNLIDFIAPTDSRKRIKQIVAGAKKFIYLVAYAGITGKGKSENLQEVIADIKTFTNTPVYVGFGVDQHTAKEKAKGVDGVIVGSAFVKVLLNESLSGTQKITEIATIAKEIKEKINI